MVVVVVVSSSVVAVVAAVVVNVVVVIIIIHRGYDLWSLTTVVIATKAVYVCPPQTGSGGDNLESKPQSNMLMV